MSIKNRLYGIRNKLMTFTILTAVLPILVGGGIILGSINNSVTELNVENYSYNNSKVADNYRVIVDGLDEMIQNFVWNTNVQKSLSNTELTPQEQIYVNRSIWYTNSQYVEYGIYVDNKNYMYYGGKRTEHINTDDILNQGLLEKLDESYARTTIGYGSISIEGKEETGLFMMKSVRHMNLDVPRGVLILKLNEKFYEDVFLNIKKDTGTAYFIMDKYGNICYRSAMEEISDKILKEMLEKDISVGTVDVVQDAGKMYLVSSDEKGEFFFISSVMNSSIYSTVIGILQKIIGILIISMIICIVLSILISRPYLRGISCITKTMTEFNEESFHQMIAVETNTELDQIAESYNKMVSRIEDLLNEVKREQEELRKSEYDLLVHQINPHFLYNTLDNIRMLSRMHGDDKTVQLIEALSKMLRIGLSKGETEIKLLEELKHVQAYMEIEKIRMDELFSYDCQLDEQAADIKIPKLILQPIVENCIKHGFEEIEKGGIIKIRAVRREKRLIIVIYNNGTAIDKESQKILNEMQSQKHISHQFSKEEGGYGISNVINRLNIRYGANYRMVYKGISDGTVCKIEIDL